MDETQALVPAGDETVTTITLPAAHLHYDDALAQAGQVADELTTTDVFTEYRRQLAPNTHEAQRDALQLLAAFLAQAGVKRSVDDLYRDPQAWRGMTYGLLKLFRDWLLEQSYTLGTLNQRLAIVRQYCTLAHQAGAIPDEAYELIMTVKGYGGKAGRNVDAERESRGQATRKSTKKAQPTRVLTGQALRLKRTTTKPARARRWQQDMLLTERDALLMGLLIEHALRVSEVVALDVGHVDLERGLVTVYSSKNHAFHTQALKTHTRLAAERYVEKGGRTEGPLFLGYGARRMTRYGLYDRVQALGRQVGIERLSPHDLRHFFVIDALAQGTSIDRVQAGGNWKSPMMVLHYARRTGIANEGVVISEALALESEEEA